LKKGRQKVKNKFLPAAILIILATGLFTGCGRSSTVAASLDKQVVLYVGQTARISVNNSDVLVIRFVSVTADSRCPSDVTCIQAGEVRCQMEIRDTGTSNIPEAVVLTQPPLSMTYKNYLLTYDVQPYPKSTETIKKEDYHIVLTVSNQNVTLFPAGFSR
jgi:hypothetical protein